MLPRRWNANKDRQRHLTTLFVLARRPELADKFPSVTSYVPKTDNGDDWKARLITYARDSDPVDLAEVLKLVLRRLAPQERPIIDPDVYVKFVQSEHAASYPRRAYADMLLPKLSEETGEVLHAVFEVCNSIALYAETNAMTAGRLCHLFGWWLLGEKPDGVTNWSDLYDGYKLAGQRAEHLFYAHLRWQTKQQKMPRRLVQLIINYPFGESSASSEHLPLPPASTFSRKVLHVALGTDASVPRGSDPERVANEALVAKADDEVTAPEWEDVSKPDGKTVTLDDILAEGSRAFIEEFLQTKNIDILSPPTSPRLSPEPDHASRRRSQSHGDIPRLGSASPSSPGSPTKLSPGNAGPTGWSDFEKMGFSDTSDNVKGISLSLVQPTASTSTPRPKPKRTVTTSTEPKITYLIAAEEIIELDDAFIQFVEDGQLDLSASSTWPRFALLQLKKPTNSSTAEEPINWVLVTVQKRIPRVTAPDDDPFDINTTALDRSVSPGRESSVSRLSSTFGLKDFATNWRSSGMFHSKSSRKSFLGSTRSSRGGDSIRGNESIRSSSHYDGSTNNVSTLPVVNEGDKNKLSTSSEAPTEYTITEMGEMVKVPLPRSSSISATSKAGVAAAAGVAAVAGAGAAGGTKRLTQVLEDEEPSKLTQTAASDWVYLGEGGAHVVFRYQGEEPELQGHAIRLKKVGAATGPGEVWSHTLLPQLVDSKLMISVTTSRVNEEWARSVVTPNEMVRDSERRAEGTLAELVDYALPAQIMEDLTAPIQGEKVIALEIKPKWGFLPSETDVKPTEAAAIKSKNCRYCLHQHFRGELDEEAGYCPIDLYSGDETRVRKALAGLWNAWSKTDGKKNNLRVNVDGKAVLPSNVSFSALTKLTFQADAIPTNGKDLAEGTFDFVAPLLKSSGVLTQLATLQSTLDVSDISDLKERFAAEHPGAEPFTPDLVPEPTAEELESFVAKYKANPDGANWTLREREIAYGLGAIFKDCSIIVRSVLAPEGDGWKLDEAKSSVKLIDLDLKPLKLSHWAELDDKLWRYWDETKGAASTSSGQFLAVGGGSGIVRDKTFGPGASELPLETPPSPARSIPNVDSANEELARMTQDDSNSNFSPVTPSAAVMPAPLQMPPAREEQPAEEPEVAPAAVEPVAAPVVAAVEQPAEPKAEASDAFADAPGDVAPVDTKGPAPVFTPAPAPPVARSSSRAASTKASSVKAPSVKAPSIMEKTPVAEPAALPVETKTEEAPVAKAETSEAVPIESPESDATAKPTETPTNGNASPPKVAEPTPAVEVTAPAAEEKAPVAPATPVTPTAATTPAKPNTPSKSESQLATPTQSPVKVARKKSSVFTSLKTKISSKFDDKDKAAKKAAAATSPKQAETKKAVSVDQEQPSSPTRINKKAAAGAAAGMGTVAAGIAVYENKAKKVAEELKAESERRASREFVRDRSVSVDLARRKSLFEEPALVSSTSTGPSPDTSLSTETAPDEPIATPAGETTDPVIASAEDSHAEPERRVNKPASIVRTWEKETEEKEDVPETPKAKAIPPTVKVPEPLLSPAATDNSPLTPGVAEMPSPPALITPVEDSDRGRRSDAPSPTSASTPVTIPSIAQSVASSSRDIPVPIATIPMPTTPEIELGTSPLRASPLPKSEDVKRYSLTELPPLPDGTPGSRRVSRVSFDGNAFETASVVSSVDHRGFDTAPDTPQLDQDEFAAQQPQFGRGGMASTSTFGGTHNNMEHLSEEMRRKRVSMNESEAMSEAAWLGSPVHTTKVLPEEPEP